MKPAHLFCTMALFFFVVVAGCKDDRPEKPKASRTDAEKRPVEDKLKANLAKLDVADRSLAEAQTFCAVANKSRLGSMGVPVKITLKDQPVFLCCKSCQEEALADPAKTLDKVAELKKKSADAPSK